MQLRYRGITYQRKNHPVESVETGITAKFLGQTYAIRKADYLIFVRPCSYKYRGVSYQKGIQNSVKVATIYPEDRSLLINAS